MAVGQTAPPARSYKFDGGISLDVLENYLSRAVQYLGLCSEGSSGPAPHFEDNLRLLKHTGAKFVGRAAYAWDCPADDEAHFRIARENAARVHAQDPEIVLQCCIFETAYSARAPETKQRIAQGFSGAGVENIPVPAWVFEEFGLPPVKRGFDYQAMLYLDGRMRNLWLPGASVPDITRLETRMWFFYRAVRYLDAGYEAIHFGQVQLMGQNDPGYRHWQDLLARVRRYAAAHARRHWVLCDAHFAMTIKDPGVVVEGRLLWDFVGFPLRPVEGDKPLSAFLKVGHADSMYGRAPGGIHPAGWRCEVIPQLYEVDNCQTGLTTAGGIFVWGADEATWLANLPESERNAFLRYAWNWIWEHAPHGYFQMPGRRPAAVPVNRPRLWSYVANTRSTACPDGFNQEETFRAIWADPRYADNTARKAVAQQELPHPVTAANRRAAFHWRFDSLPTDGGRTVVKNVMSGGPDGHIEKGRTLEALQALYLVYGDFNEPAEKERGEAMLQRLAAAPGVELVDAPGGRAMRFRGEGYARLDRDPRYAAPACTVSMRLRLDNVEREMIVLEKFEWMQTGFYIKYHPPEKRLYAEVFDGGPVRRIAGFPGLEPGRWYDIAFTADGRQLTAYMNGRVVDSVPAGPIRSDDLPFLVGRGCVGLSVANVRFYNRALTAGEIVGLPR